jgi:hypothetical protein
MTRKQVLLLPVLSCLFVASAFAATGTEDPVPAQAGASAQKPAPAKPAAKPTPAPTVKTKKGGWLDRGYLSVNGLYQTAGPAFTQSQSWTYFAETATATIDYPAESAPGIDMAGGYRIWRNLAVGAGLTYVSRPTTTVVSGSLPNPLYLNKPTTLSGGFAASHSETAVNVLAMWAIPLRPKMLLMVGGGPSFVSVTQTIVVADGIGVSLVYPYDSGSIRSAKTTDSSQLALGFSVGADFTYRLAKTIGVGGMVRYARASADFPVAGQPSVPVATGGLEVGGGLRVLFPPAKPGRPSAPVKPADKPKTPPQKK